MANPDVWKQPKSVPADIRWGGGVDRLDFVTYSSTEAELNNCITVGHCPSENLTPAASLFTPVIDSCQCVSCSSWPQGQWDKCVNLMLIQSDV